MEKLQSENGKEALQNKERRLRTDRRRSSTNMEELVVQRLNTTVSGKAQKYTRAGARKFVAFDYDEVNIANIKKACAEHYGSSIGDDMEVDVLAGEQGPSCQTMKHVKDLRLIYIRFIQREPSEYCESLAGTSATIDNDRVLLLTTTACFLQKNPEEMSAISFQICTYLIELKMIPN